MIKESDLTIVGKVNKTHGIDGEMSVSFYDADTADTVDEETCVFFKLDGIMVPFFVDGVRPRSTEALLVHLEGEDSQEAASGFVGKDVYMATDDLPDAGDEPGGGFYAAQLIGFAALTDDGRPIGTIEDVDESTDNPLFVISGDDGRSVYVPIVDEFVTDIDTQARTISFDLPEGLLEL